MASFGDIEQLVLSGKLFNGGSRSPSPVRTPSPDHVAAWPPDHPDTDEELFGSDDDKPAQPEQPQQQQQESIGMGPGRTGVKGVIRDRDEHEARARVARALELAERDAKLEKSALIARTFLEDEAAEGRTGIERTTERFGRFGHLREVGSAGFVQAVEGEGGGIWVVVHIYDDSLERCARLDIELVDLARRHPQTKFLRARAAALGFASRAAPRPARQTTARSTRIGAYEEDQDDSDADEEDEEDEEVDLDMLPTLLVYRDGELVHNWVRVDWEVRIDDIEELLSKHNVVSTVDRPLVLE